MSSRVYAITRLDAEQTAAELVRILRYRRWDIHTHEGRSLSGTSTGWNTKPGRTLDGRAILDARVTLHPDEGGIAAQVQFAPRFTLYIGVVLVCAGSVGVGVNGPWVMAAVFVVVAGLAFGGVVAYHRASVGSDIDHSLRAIVEGERPGQGKGSDFAVASVFD